MERNMKITVVGQQIDLGDNLRDYAEENLGAAVTKYFEDAIKGTVTFSKEKARTFIKADIFVHPLAGHDFSAEAEDVDAYKAFDLAVEKIETQLAKAKEKIKTEKYKAE
jgi:ribosomal subunit interface protein